MNCSFDKIVENFSDGDFKYLTEEFGFNDLELLKEKGVYTYEYMNSFERFNEEKLPDRKCFYRSKKVGTTGDDGKKSDGHISHEEYLTGKNICDVFGMINIGDYQDHYLKKYVLLKANVFEKFIETCLKFYGFDPCHYFSSSGLSWDAMFKITGFKLEKIVDIDIKLFIEKRLNGAISYIAKRCAEANNK